MARVFSIDFQYKSETYTAIVTITNANNEKTISVYVPDNGLHHILPAGKVTLRSPQIQDDMDNKAPVHELLNSIQVAIKSYEEHGPSVGLW